MIFDRTRRICLLRITPKVTMPPASVWPLMSTENPLIINMPGERNASRSWMASIVSAYNFLGETAVRPATKLLPGRTDCSSKSWSRICSWSSSSRTVMAFTKVQIACSPGGIRSVMPAQSIDITEGGRPKFGQSGPVRRNY